MQSTACTVMEATTHSTPSCSRQASNIHRQLLLRAAIAEYSRYQETQLLTKSIIHGHHIKLRYAYGAADAPPCYLMCLQLMSWSHPPLQGSPTMQRACSTCGLRLRERARSRGMHDSPARWLHRTTARSASRITACVYCVATSRAPKPPTAWIIRQQRQQQRCKPTSCTTALQKN